jgi:phytoene/squalene synthetase
MSYFIGHSCRSPQDEHHYQAVAAAHIIHMLRDTFDDIEAGYYNIPREILEENQIGLRDVQSDAYRDWVKSRLQLAREYFQAGRADLTRIHNVRYRIACLAYVARFEWLLDTIEREGHCLRPQYDERKSAWIGLRMGWRTFSSMLGLRRMDAQPRPVLLRPPEEL